MELLIHWYLGPNLGWEPQWVPLFLQLHPCQLSEFTVVQAPEIPLWQPRDGMYSEHVFSLASSIREKKLLLTFKQIRSFHVKFPLSDFSWMLKIWELKLACFLGNVKVGKKSSFIPRKALPIPSLTLLLPLSQESYSFFAPSNPTPPPRSLETRGDGGGRQDGLCYLSIIKQWWRAEGYRFLFRILTVLVRTQHFQLYLKSVP